VDPLSKPQNFSLKELSFFSTTLAASDWYQSLHGSILCGSISAYLKMPPKKTSTVHDVIEREELARIKESLERHDDQFGELMRMMEEIRLGQQHLQRTRRNHESEDNSNEEEDEEAPENPFANHGGRRRRQRLPNRNPLENIIEVTVGRLV
jgi:hypothetical protein